MAYCRRRKCRNDAIRPSSSNPTMQYVKNASLRAKHNSPIVAMVSHPERPDGHCGCMFQSYIPAWTITSYSEVLEQGDHVVPWTVLHSYIDIWPSYMCVSSAHLLSIGRQTARNCDCNIKVCDVETTLWPLRALRAHRSQSICYGWGGKASFRLNTGCRCCPPPPPPPQEASPAASTSSRLHDIMSSLVKPSRRRRTRTETLAEPGRQTSYHLRGMPNTDPPSLDMLTYRCIHGDEATPWGACTSDAFA